MEENSEAEYLSRFIKLDWYPEPPSNFPEEGKVVLQKFLTEKLPTAIGYEEQYGYFILNRGPILMWQQNNPIKKIQSHYD